LLFCFRLRRTFQNGRQISIFAQGAQYKRAASEWPKSENPAEVSVLDQKLIWCTLYTQLGYSHGRNIVFSNRECHYFDVLIYSHCKLTIYYENHVKFVYDKFEMVWLLASVGMYNALKSLLISSTDNVFSFGEELTLILFPFISKFKKNIQDIYQIRYF
jgi:hypothetical protein